MATNYSNEKVEGRILVVDNINYFYEGQNTRRKKNIAYKVYPLAYAEEDETYKETMKHEMINYFRNTGMQEEEDWSEHEENRIFCILHILVHPEQIKRKLHFEGLKNEIIFITTKSAKESFKRKNKKLYDRIRFIPMGRSQNFIKINTTTGEKELADDLYIAHCYRIDYFLQQQDEQAEEQAEEKAEEKTEETKMLNDNHSQLEKFITKDKKDIDISDVKDILKNKEEEEEEEEEVLKDYSELEVFITKDKTEDKKMLNDNHSQLEKFITKDKKDIDISDIDDIFKNKKEEKTEVLPPEEQKDYSELESFVTKDKIKDIEYIFKHQDKYAQKRYFLTSRRHQKPGDAHIPAPIVMLNCYTRILVLEDDGSYTLHIRHADSSYEKQAVILDEDGANKDILNHKEFIFMIDDDFPAELEAIKQIKEKEIVNQPEEKTSLDDIINNREKVRPLPIFIFKNTEKRENIERIHDVIKNNPLGYTIILDKDDDGFAILEYKTDDDYKKYDEKDLKTFIETHRGYNFYINEKTYEKLNKDALDKKQLVLF